MADVEEDDDEILFLRESELDDEEKIIVTMSELIGDDYDKEIRWEFDNEIQAGHMMVSSMLASAQNAQFRKLSENFDDLTIQAYAIYHFKNNILETIEEKEIRDTEGGREVDIRNLKLNLRQEMIVFYTLSSAVIEDLCIQLIIDELVPQERVSNSIQTHIEHKRQSEREQILYNFGVIGEGIKGEIRGVMKLRNNLLHNPGRRVYLETVEDIRTEISRSIRVLDRLHSMLYEDDFSSRLGMWEGDLDFLS